jgi:hypothetical protein
MTASSARRLPDALTELLEVQHGVLTTNQAVTLGITRNTVRAHIAAHRWQQLHQGVYAAFTGPVPFHSRVWAGLLRAGATGTASHLTAACLDGLANEPGDIIHVTVEPSRRVTGRLDGIRLHYATRLAVMRQPTRLPPRTRVEETVLDLVAAATTVDEVATWITRACQRRLTTPERLAAALVERKKIRWRGTVEAMVTDAGQGVQSPLEMEYLRRVERAHALPVGIRNRPWMARRVTWIDVDLDEYDLRVELDGRVGHEDEGRFRDRRRDNRSTVSGKFTLRYGHAEVFGDPCGIATEVAAVLAMRGWAGHLRRCGPHCTTPP